MTDRIRSLTVILDKDFRDDDIEYIAHAIRMIKHVSSVELGEPVNLTDHIARQEARLNLGSKIMDVIRER